MRVLFVPQAEGGPAHVIPLMALGKMLSRGGHETAFLVPRFIHKFMRQLGCNVLDIDQRGWTTNGFRSELRAYKLFAPDVVVDDASLTTRFATAMAKLPRVAVQRTGMFPGYRPRNAGHRHSMNERDVSRLPDVTSMGIPQPRAFTDLFEAEMKIIPGVRSIEVLPPALRDDPTFVYSGPLLMDDYLMEQVGLQDLWVSEDCLDITQCRDFTPLERFFEAQAGRQVVYATFGTMAQVYDRVRDCVRHLLDNGVAVITTIKMPDLSPAQRELYYYARYLPAHFVCERVTLVIHQCGSGTYHYPLLHERPAITVGTMCYDREDVALRLEELGASAHLPAPEECEDFVGQFKRLTGRFLAPVPEEARRRAGVLSALKKEIERTAAAFDFEEVLREAARLARGGAGEPAGVRGV
jgi:UDP:flavonoid glycosyltransferase YjiC (YdhE family)